MSEPSTHPMRRALRAMSHGVYVLSVGRTSAHSRDEYLIVSLAMQCSVEPPRVAFAVGNHARILEPLRNAGSALLSVLGQDQRLAVRRYGTPGGVRSTANDVTRSTRGHPVPPECAFWLELLTTEEIARGDHVLFVANVADAGVIEPSDDAFEPLTLANSKFPYAG